MNTEKLDQALDQIGYQAALDWAPFRAASLQGVLVSIVAQPSVEVRKADREAVLALSEGVASIRESASNIREALPKLSASMRQILEGPSEFGALLEAFLEQCEVLEQIEPSATLAVEVAEHEKGKRGTPPATKERRVIEACAEIYVLAHNSHPSWGSNDCGAPSTPFTRAMVQVLEALGLSSKSCPTQCRKVCEPLRGNQAAIKAIRQHGILERHLRRRE